MPSDCHTVATPQHQTYHLAACLRQPVKTGATAV